MISFCTFPKSKVFSFDESHSFWTREWGALLSCPLSGNTLKPIHLPTVLPRGLAVCLHWLPGSHSATRGKGSRGIGAARPQHRGCAHQSGRTCQCQGVLPVPVHPGRGWAALVPSGAIHCLKANAGAPSSYLVMTFLFLSLCLRFSPALLLFPTYFLPSASFLHWLLLLCA